jgi:hypothetical protein
MSLELQEEISKSSRIPSSLRLNGVVDNELKGSFDGEDGAAKRSVNLILSE